MPRLALASIALLLLASSHPATVSAWADDKPKQGTAKDAKKPKIGDRRVAGIVIVDGCNRPQSRDYAAFLGHLFPDPF